mgnify:CR=1 FL=1
MIQVTDLSKSFDGFLALDHTDMHVPKGSVYGLVGPNGAGKSTIIRHLTGIYKPDSGSIMIDGMPVYNNPAVKERIIYIPDELFYFAQANTETMRNYYRKIYQGFDDEKFETLRPLFPAVDTRRPIRKLSKGMQKQVIFWISLCCRPDLLILDEPVDGLDPLMRRQIWSLIMSETSEREMTVLISSHNLRELEDVCDHVGIMHKGKLLLEQSLESLQEGFSKVQIAFADGLPKMPPDIEVLHQSSVGRVHSLIVKGRPEVCRVRFERMNPLLLDLLPLSLEEIFIYELGGVDGAFKNILL